MRHIEILLPVIIHLASRGVCVHMKLPEISGTDWLKLHLTITVFLNWWLGYDEPTLFLLFFLEP